MPHQQVTFIRLAGGVGPAEALACAHGVHGWPTKTKALDGGKGEMGPAGLAEDLAHAEASARGAEIVVLTDGPLGSGLSFTEWNAVRNDQSGVG